MLLISLYRLPATDADRTRELFAKLEEFTRGVPLENAGMTDRSLLLSCRKNSVIPTSE